MRKIITLSHSHRHRWVKGTDLYTRPVPFTIAKNSNQLYNIFTSIRLTRHTRVLYSRAGISATDFSKSMRYAHSNGISRNLQRSRGDGSSPCATANVWTNPHIIQSIVNPITRDVMLLVGVTHNENVTCIGNDLISRSNSAFATTCIIRKSVRMPFNVIESKRQTLVSLNHRW